MKRIVTAFVLSLVATTTAFAQLQGGVVAIGGTITDAQGGAVVGARVTAEGTDGTFTAKTDAKGEYRFVDLAPGRYRVAAETDDLASEPKQAIVTVGRRTELNLTMSITARAEAVTVTAPSPMVDRTATGLGADVSDEELRYIPTSRDPFAIGRTTPGVLLDQVNVGGAETGQQPITTGKGTRPQDVVWTLDGIEITDMGAPGLSPTYFNFDNFDEIHVSTAGNDIRSRTGGIGINLVTKRGTNQLSGNVRGYFSGKDLEASNVPGELEATGVTPATADHTTRTSDYGFDIGGPILKDLLWFYGSLSQQDIRVFRRSTKSVDSTKLRNPQVKVNWQATGKDLVNFLFINGYKLKDGRSNPANGSTFEDFSATHHQDNAYSDAPLHGLWKIGVDRVVSSHTFVSAKYAYYNTGIALTPEGGMDRQAGRSIPDAHAYGSTVRTLQVRPQHYFAADANEFFHLFGASHNLKYGTAYRRILNDVEVEWPGNGILGVVVSPTDLRAQIFRESRGGNLMKYVDFYVGDTVSLRRLTLDFGARYDRQWGNALASTTEGNKAFPSLVPGVEFAGYRTPFTWKNLSPRVGMSYQIDDSGKTVARVSFSRYAGQLADNTVGWRNTSTGSTPGNAIYRWNDLNGDFFVQADEVDLTKFMAAANGFNPTNPTALAPSPQEFASDLKAPVTTSVVAGLEHELAPNLAVLVGYTYNRTSKLFGNLTSNITPRVGVPLSAYVPSYTLTGTLPDGSEYAVPTFYPTGNIISGGFVAANVPDYYVDYNGLEVSAVKRLSNRWMGRVAFGYNNARDHFTSDAGRYNTNGNPTTSPQEPLQDGGQHAPTSSLAGGIFLNAKWQVNVNGMYIAPGGIELAANVFGRQGYPFPIYRGSVKLSQVAGNTETTNVMVSPKVDTFRYDNVWNTDLRVAKSFRLATGSGGFNIRLMADVFNLFNANTVLARVGNIGGLGTNGVLATPASSFNSISKNLSPRIVRFGLVVGF